MNFKSDMNILGDFELKCTEEDPIRLMCPVCIDLLNEPYQHGCCGKRFCKKCSSKQLQKCPWCTMFVKNRFPDTRANELVSETNIFCVKHKNGCVWTGKLKYLEGHLNDDCDHCQMKCPQCNNVVLIRTYKEHLDNHCVAVQCGRCHVWFPKKTFDCHVCPFDSMQCRLGCQSTFEHRHMKKHNSLCSKRFVKCRLFSKCGNIVQMDRMFEHFVECSKKYIGNIFEIINNRALNSAHVVLNVSDLDTHMFQSKDQSRDTYFLSKPFKICNVHTFILSMNIEKPHDYVTVLLHIVRSENVLESILKFLENNTIYLNLCEPFGNKDTFQIEMNCVNGIGNRVTRWYKSEEPECDHMTVFKCTEFMLASDIGPYTIKHPCDQEKKLDFVIEFENTN